jgi:hypothetical protein
MSARSSTQFLARKRNMLFIGGDVADKNHHLKDSQMSENRRWALTKVCNTFNSQM